MIANIPCCRFCKKEFSKEQYYHEHMAKKSPCCYEAEKNMMLETNIKLLEKLVLERNVRKVIEDSEKMKKDEENVRKAFETNKSQQKSIFSNVIASVNNIIGKKKYKYQDDVYEKLV